MVDQPGGRRISGTLGSRCRPARRRDSPPAAHPPLRRRRRPGLPHRPVAELNLHAVLRLQGQALQPRNSSASPKWTTRTGWRSSSPSAAKSWGSAATTGWMIPTEAEVAFNISDAHQGRGIGSILLEHLAAAARENGIRRFSAEVLPENRKMLMVFSDAGYDVKRHFDDGVVSLEFNIDPTEKSRAVMESREHRAEASSVRDLLTPSSVAVIGASRKWGTVGYQLLEHIIEGGFTGPVYAINPEALELAGMLSFGKLSEVPEPGAAGHHRRPVRGSTHGGGRLRRRRRQGPGGRHGRIRGRRRTRPRRGSGPGAPGPGQRHAGDRPGVPGHRQHAPRRSAERLHGAHPAAPRRPGPVQPVRGHRRLPLRRVQPPPARACPPSSPPETAPTYPATTSCSTGRTTPTPPPWASTWNRSATRASSPAWPGGCPAPNR